MLDGNGRQSARFFPEFGAVAVMERLWAGWRASYIEEVTAPTSGDDDGRSVFTRILESGLPDEETHIVWRGDLTFAILNRFPYITGHVLVMPYREVAELEDLTDAEHQELWSTVTDCVRAIKAAYRPDGVNLGMNLGAGRGCWCAHPSARARDATVERGLELHDVRGRDEGVARITARHMAQVA